MTTRQRLLWLDTLKGWGIAFIVLGHIVGAGVHLSDGASQTFCTKAYQYFYTFHVPLFFCIAGMTLHPAPWGRFLYSRIRRLLVPYFVIGLLSAFAYALTIDLIAPILQYYGGAYYEDKVTHPSLWASIKVLFSGNIARSSFVANQVLWFIPALFSVTVVGHCLIHVSQRWWAWILFCVGALMLVRWGSLPELPWCLNAVPYYLIYLTFGILLGQPVFERLKWPMTLGLGLTCVIGFGALAVCGWPESWHPLLKLLWPFPLLFLVCGNIFGWFLLSRALPCRPLGVLGIASLGIMLFHKFPIILLQNVLPWGRALFQHGFLQMIVGVVIIFLISVVLSLIVYCLLLYYLPWLFGKVAWPLGNRFKKDSQYES